MTINGKEVAHQYSLDDLLDTSAREINPEIYVRLARPLKDDSQIDLIDLNSFYKHNENHGLSLNVSPDYTFNENSMKIIE